MNIHQRLSQLERATAPAKDDREPLLLEFVGNDGPVELAAILYIYGSNPATYRLNTQQLADYKASQRNGTTEAWINGVPRPTRPPRVQLAPESVKPVYECLADDDKQPSNRTVNDTLTSDKYNYRKLKQEGNDE